MDVSSLGQWVSTVFGRSEPGRAEPDEYFTPRIARADRQLQALATRLGGTYRREALSWSALAAAPKATAGAAPDALWGRGSSVTKRMHGLELEVTVGVQSLATGEHGDAAVSRWLVLAPGVTVAAGPRSGPMRFDRFAANWCADDEVESGAVRLRRLLARDAAPPAPLPTLPVAVASARDRLIEKAAKLVCDPAYVFVVGRPLPRPPEGPRQFGEASFEVDALFDLVERSRAFANAIATG